MSDLIECVIICTKNMVRAYPICQTLCKGACNFNFYNEQKLELAMQNFQFIQLFCLLALADFLNSVREYKLKSACN